jgi:hypothetical protein
VKEGKNDSITALFGVEGTHRRFSLSYFPKDPLYNIDGSYLDPVFFWSL